MTATNTLPIYVVEGIDGSGKTTTVERLGQIESGSRFSIDSIKTLQRSHFHDHRSCEILAKLIWPSADWKQYATVMPVDYWIGLQYAWYASLSAEVSRREEGSAVRLFDGWWLKFAAKLVVDGLDESFVLTLFSRLGTPAKTVILDCPPEIAWERKTFSAYEAGAFQTSGPVGRDTFIEFQSQVRSVLLKWASEFGWRVVPVSEGNTLDRVCNEVMALFS